MVIRKDIVVLGVGGCDEMASFESFLLRLSGFECREVRFSGEDHVFVEVYVNGC